MLWVGLCWYNDCTAVVAHKRFEQDRDGVRILFMAIMPHKASENNRYDVRNLRLWYLITRVERKTIVSQVIVFPQT